VSHLSDLTLERASLATAGTADALRLRLRHAPASVRLAIDRERRAQGLDSLWPDRGITPTSKPDVNAFAYKLVGVVAPHIARPVSHPGRAAKLPEKFTRTCWQKAISRLDKQKSVTLRLGHAGGAIADTFSGTLRFLVDDELGLTLTADLPKHSALLIGSRAAGSSLVDLSLGFIATSSEVKTILGEQVRVVTDCRLDHVAILPADQRPAYPGAVGRLMPAGTDEDLRQAWSTVRRESLLRLTRRNRSRVL
jgi:hypothetical protein